MASLAASSAAAARYVDDMYARHRKTERELHVKPTFLARQPALNERMRSILVDWIVDVHKAYKLAPETLYLAVRTIDRYLAATTVSRAELQLVGVASLLLAFKHEELLAPKLSDLVSLTDKAYSETRILEAEAAMAKALGYRLAGPTALTFLARYLKAGGADRRCAWLAAYVAERTLQEYAMLAHLPSAIAAASVLVARRSLGEEAWTPALAESSGYARSDLAACLRDLRVVLRCADALQPTECLRTEKDKLHAVRRKYALEDFGAVESVPLVLDDDDVEPPS